MESLHSEPQRDQFRTESPIRAFTEWTVNGRYAIGKGFRPSLQHTTTYLDAMEAREGWRLVQLLEAGSQTPSFLFRQCREITDEELRARHPALEIEFLPRDASLQPTHAEITSDSTIPVEKHEDVLRFIAKERGMDGDRLVRDFMMYFGSKKQVNQSSHRTFESQVGFILPRMSPAKVQDYIARYKASSDYPADRQHTFIDEKCGVDIYEALADNIRAQTGVEEASRGDPINPKHYNGRECADIGERLTANGYQILKYCWRLGKKDDPCVELGKALWYLDSEVKLIGYGGTVAHATDAWPELGGRGGGEHFLQSRLKGQPPFTQTVAAFLWNGYTGSSLEVLQGFISDEKIKLECGSGLAV